MKSQTADAVVVALCVAVPVVLIVWFTIALAIRICTTRQATRSSPPQPERATDAKRRFGLHLMWSAAIAAAYVIVLPLAVAFLLAGAARRFPEPTSTSDHRPSTTGPYVDFLRRVAHDPIALHLPFENVEFPTADKRILRGWLIPTSQTDVSTAIALVHGIGGDRRSMMGNVPFFHDLGYTVLLFDCRNYGGSDGDGAGTTFGVHESQDVSSAVAFLKSYRHVKRVVVFGASQGAASAIMAAGSNQMIDGVIAWAPFGRMQDLVDAGEVIYGYPHWFGGLYAAVSNARLGLRDHDGLWTLNDEAPVLSPVVAVTRISPRPILLIHGTADSLISYHVSQDLFARAKAPKSLWLIPGAEHEDPQHKAQEEFPKRVGGFLHEFFPVTAGHQQNE